uniref:Uncharacterized protein n=1 Tax=Anguilla anguilla TaxID=7936 RepID=A0A0E9TM33_ANGAN
MAILFIQVCSISSFSII